MKPSRSGRPFPLSSPLLRRDAGARGAFVDVLGMRLAYDDEGSGPAIVCLHALGHGAADFAPLRERLRDRYRVVALDFPDHGASSSDREPVSATRYANVVDAFLAETGIEDAVIVGNSIGGAAAIELAAKRPERVRALVVANPGGLFARSVVSWAFATAFARFFALGARGSGWFPRAFAAYYGLVLTEPAAREQRARIVLSAREIAPVLAEGWASFADAGSDLRDTAAAVQCPVLVTWADKDVSNPLRISRRGIARFPHAELKRFRAGHNPFLETPDEAAAALDDFLHRQLPHAS